MKKQFFYAALAIGMMSSCSSNDLPGNQAPEEQLPEEERVAIELGISSPNAKIEASTKGIGSVGGTGDAGDENKWNGETLGVWMYEVKSDGSLAKAFEPGTTDTYIFDGLDFKAPTSTDKGKIEIFQAGSSTTHQVKYYPSKGKFAFYGYHIDDAGALVTPDYDNRKITGLSIDGTQDIMAALTLPVNDENYSPSEPVGSTSTLNWGTYAAQSFSAWAARRGIQPILNFEHKLARLRFFVKAGDPTAASKTWNNTQWEDRPLVDTEDEDTNPDASQAVKITSIKIDGLQSALDLSFVTEESIDKSKLEPNTTEVKTTFTLMGPDTDGEKKLLPLTHQAPTYWSHAGGTSKDAEGYKEKDQIGATMMFLPWAADGTNTELKLKIGVEQAVLDTYGANEATDATYKLKRDEMTTTLQATKVVTGGSPEAPTYATAFEAGKSYDVTIIVYSYQRIEIEAQLSKWEKGGSIEVAPGDEF